jgi:hypothetical protein
MFGIYLRFGSLTDDSQVHTSYEDIKHYTGIPHASMVRHIHKWRRLGKDVLTNFQQSLQEPAGL